MWNYRLSLYTYLLFLENGGQVASHNTRGTKNESVICDIDSHRFTCLYLTAGSDTCLVFIIIGVSQVAHMGDLSCGFSWPARGSRQPISVLGRIVGM